MTCVVCKRGLCLVLNGERNIDLDFESLQASRQLRDRKDHDERREANWYETRQKGTGRDWLFLSLLILDHLYSCWDLVQAKSGATVSYQNEIRSEIGWVSWSIWRHHRDRYEMTMISISRDVACNIELVLRIMLRSKGLSSEISFAALSTQCEWDSEVMIIAQITA